MNESHKIKYRSIGFGLDVKNIAKLCAKVSHTWQDKKELTGLITDRLFRQLQVKIVAN